MTLFLTPLRTPKWSGGHCTDSPRLCPASHGSPLPGRCSLWSPSGMSLSWWNDWVPLASPGQHPAPSPPASSPQPYRCAVIYPLKAKATFSCLHVPTCYCSISLLSFAVKLDIVVPTATPHNPPPTVFKQFSAPLIPTAVLFPLCPCSGVTSIWWIPKLGLHSHWMCACPTSLSWLLVASSNPCCSSAHRPMLISASISTWHPLLLRPLPLCGSSSPLTRTPAIGPHSTLPLILLTPAETRFLNELTFMVQRVRFEYTFLRT